MSEPGAARARPATGVVPWGVPVLFDIDGTLLRTDQARYLVALRTLLHAAYGLDPAAFPDPAAPHGKTDLGILHDVLRTAFDGRPPPGPPPEHAILLLPLFYPHPVSPAAAVLPGARRALRAVRRAGHPLGLLTGNVEALAWAKLRRHGLHAFFHFGAFGDQAGDRRALVRPALRAAQAVYGVAFPPAHAIVVGDTPSDIRCARANGARCVAVALPNGAFEREALRAEEPDALVTDLGTIPAAIAALRERM